MSVPNAALASHDTDAEVLGATAVSCPATSTEASL